MVSSFQTDVRHSVFLRFHLEFVPSTPSQIHNRRERLRLSHVAGVIVKGAFDVSVHFDGDHFELVSAISRLGFGNAGRKLTLQLGLKKSMDIGTYNLRITYIRYIILKEEMVKTYRSPILEKNQKLDVLLCLDSTN